MDDKSKVLKAFEECLCKSHDYCKRCYQQGPAIGFVCQNNVCLEVLEMLKEQKATEIVRCQDCKHGIQGVINKETGKVIYIICEKGNTHSPDWFCGDGKRKDDG